MDDFGSVLNTEKWWLIIYENKSKSCNISHVKSDEIIQNVGQRSKNKQKYKWQESN